MIIIGFLLVLAGWFFPLLMVMKLLESTFLLSFLSYAFSIGGILLGVIGTAMYTSMNRRK